MVFVGGDGMEILAWEYNTGMAVVRVELRIGF